MLYHSSEQAKKEWELENGISPGTQLSPEQSEQAQQQINQKVKYLTPEDIDRYMADEYK